MKTIFAKISYDIFIKDREAYYHTVVYLVVKLLGINIHTEVETNIGRLDAVIETETHIYVMEFKLGTAAAALSQIKDNKYYEKYLDSRKQIKIIGIGFNEDERNIKDFAIEDIMP